MGGCGLLEVKPLELIVHPSIEKCMPMILSGIGLHDKYKSARR
jgi:hypothetical protein